MLRAMVIVKQHINYAKKNGSAEISFYLCPDNKLCRFEIDGRFFGDMKSNLNLHIIEVIEKELKKHQTKARIGKAKYKVKGRNNVFTFDTFTFVFK